MSRSLKIYLLTTLVFVITIVAFFYLLATERFLTAIVFVSIVTLFLLCNVVEWLIKLENSRWDFYFRDRAFKARTIRNMRQRSGGFGSYRQMPKRVGVLELF